LNTINQDFPRLSALSIAAGNPADPAQARKSLWLQSMAWPLWDRAGFRLGHSYLCTENIDAFPAARSPDRSAAGKSGGHSNEEPID
jgi:hypothetical protein